MTSHPGRKHRSLTAQPPPHDRSAKRLRSTSISPHAHPPRIPRSWA